MSHSRKRIVVAALGFSTFVAAAACNSSVSPSALPRSSSGLSGSTISGQVNGGGSASSLATTSSGTGAGMTVTSEGTGKSTTVDSAGRFILTGLSEGRHQLRFTGPGTDARIPVTVGRGERVEITVRIIGNNATIESERREPSANRGDDDDEDEGDEFKGLVSGLTGTCPAITFKINGTTFVTNAQTKFEDGPCTAVANGKSVEVEGTRGSNGTVTATKVELYY